jgi:hypothetical protein
MMAAIAHQFDDEPIDPAEEPMPAADFRVIQRAHELCDHAPAVDITVDLGNSELSNTEHVRLLPHAVKIMHAHRRARELVHQMQQRGDFDLGVSDLVETDSVDSQCCESTRLDLVDDKPGDEVVTDWQQVAQAAWADAGWKSAAEDYHRTRRGVRQ